MNTLENITANYKADLDKLNQRIHNRLDSNNPLLGTIVRSLLRTKGKQIRPLLVLMSARMCGEINEKVLAAGAAVELLHNASLIHDDVVDNSMTRRNMPTVNAVWDNHVAVLVGDFFTASAMHEAISTGDIRIVDVLCKLGKDLSMGEIDQICNAREHTLDENTYYRIIDYKTASLFLSSAQMGCLAVGADEEHTKALMDYALYFGRCFQIRDDIFDYYPAELVGKPTGNDLREGKISLPLIYALSKEDAPGRAEALELIKHDALTDEQIAELQAFARDNGGIDYACNVMRDLRVQALDGLAVFGDCPECKELATLFDFIIERQF
ncbi:MAG: polyprenyl synthetase family protein [Muribaculaceae bacterium]|nr:polyprenyl synthetase family protein [Muribaculaceae bacterium]